MKNSIMNLGKIGDCCTVVELSSYYNARLFVYTAVSGGEWQFIDAVDFGGRVAGTEYHIETGGDHVWLVGNSCRGHGTGESRYYQDWYEITDKGKRLVLSFPYDEYMVNYPGGYIIRADSVNTETSGSTGDIKVLADYTITKQYALELDIADENGMVNVNEKRTVEYIWNETKESFVSVYEVDESGLTIVETESTEITRQCDAILENYYNELKKGLNEIDKLEASFSRAARVGGLKLFLKDCSEGNKKAELLSFLERMGNNTY